MREIPKMISIDNKQLDYVTPERLDSVQEGNSAISVNVRSLLANGDKLEALINKTQPTIVAIQETWQTTRDFEGYQIEFIVRPTKRGGGVGILVREGHTYTLRHKSISKNVELIAVSVQRHVFIWRICLPLAARS